MRILKIIEKIMCFILDRPYIPEAFYNKERGPLLLHISDTPAEIFPYLKKLVEKINPQYIVHTGDIVDNIKLETDKNKLEEYKKELVKIVKIIEANNKTKVYYAIGNHDHKESLKLISKSRNVEEDGVIDIHGLKIYISHYYKDKMVEVDFYLYGHSFEPAHFKGGNLVGLNGIQSVNIIDLETREVFQVKYPVATNRWRRMERGRLTI